MYRRRRRMSSPRSVIQSFKKVINHAPASLTTATQTWKASTGTDSVAAGQTSATDFAVPTGSIIKYIEFQWCQQNLVNVAAFTHLQVIRLHSGQVTVAPNAVGGSPIRNQVHHQECFCLGQNQNVNRVIRFKVPKKFQRVREGDIWQLNTITDQVSTGVCQILYKFYR